MQPLDSSSSAAAAEGFLDDFIDGLSTVAPEELPHYAALAAVEVFSAAQQAPIVVGYRELPNLTNRQLEILELLNTGKTPKDVREEFWIKKKTMEKHMSRIHQAFGTNWYWEAVREARRMGILAYPGAS